MLLWAMAIPPAAWAAPARNVLVLYSYSRLLPANVEDVLDLYFQQCSVLVTARDLAMMAATPVLVLVNLGVGGICWWGSVALVGGGRDFTPAWRIFCYAQAGMALGLIPFFGLLVAGIWVLALMYCGVKQVYGISAGGSLGALALYLGLQVLLALTLLLGLAGVLAGLGLLLLLG